MCCVSKTSYDFVVTNERKPNSNNSLAEVIGCDYTTVSRLRSGKRLPSRVLAQKVITAYQLTPEQQAQWFSAMAESEEASGRFLRDHVFNAENLPS